MMRKNILICFLMAFALSAFGQTRKAFLEAAEASFASKDYYSALHYYQNVLEFHEDIHVLYKGAEAARLFNAYKLAEQYYQQVVDLEQNGEFPLALFHLAEMQKRIGKYEQAKRNYEIYLSENELDNPYYTDLATRQIEDCDWALEQSQNPRSYVTVDRLGETINTPFSEFGPIRIGDTLYYSSLRFPSETDEAVPRRIFSNVLWSIKGGEGIQIDSTFNDATLHTAHAVFAEDMNRVYYTLCEYLNATDIRCDLYYRDIVNGVMGSPVKLPGTINDTTHTTTQPSIGKDPINGDPALYFV